MFSCVKHYTPIHNILLHSMTLVSLDTSHNVGTGLKVSDTRFLFDGNVILCRLSWFVFIKGMYSMIKHKENSVYNVV